jgi:hypothetical protein
MMACKYASVITYGTCSTTASTQRQPRTVAKRSASLVNGRPLHVVMLASELTPAIKCVPNARA